MSRICSATVCRLSIMLICVGCLHLQAARVDETGRPHPGVVHANRAGQGSAPVALSEPRAMLDRYCVTCHNEKLKTAGLLLDRMDVERVSDDSEIWERVARKLRLRAMPPAGLPRPEPATYRAVASWLEAGLDRAAAARPNPGAGQPIHRLNRTEYTNAIRDLLGIEIDGASVLPPDDAAHGFDNIAGVLSVSPVLLERYLSAARKIGRLAVGDRDLAINPGFQTYNVPKLLAQDDRMSEDLPFGSRGGLAIRHYFPLDGEYVVKVRLRGNLYDYIVGLGEPSQLEVRVDGVRVGQFTVGGERRGKPGPETYSGNILGDPEWEQYLHEADAGLEVRFRSTAGARVVGVSFVNKVWEPEGVRQPRPILFAVNVDQQWWDGHPAVDSVAIGGPYQLEGLGETVSRRRVFVCRPADRENEEPCAKKILSTLARRAYRRPVTQDDVQTLLTFYKAGRSRGDFDAGIRRALERMLVDPDFLFRIEHAPSNVPAGTVYRLSEFELASRLSFFLWSSIPDDELLDLAARGQLHDAAVLERQVRRMVADARSKALVDNFFSQWLELRKLQGATPDSVVFPEFDENLREAFWQETALFLDSQLREDGRVGDLLTANYTFVNERLARHYGVPNVYGNHFRRVTVGEERRGLLGHGSILTVTSNPNRTSPVLRGKWVLDNVLGMPPAPPPPNVPALEDSGDKGKPQSVRQQMEQHRKNAVCAACHVQMDPLGFAFENFDGLGRWRSASDGLPIDVSGTFVDGTRFEGVAGVRNFVLSHRDQFVRTVTEKLLTYALGRAVEYYDLPAVRQITQEAAAHEDRWSALILGVVKSVPFQMRRSVS